MFGPSIWFVRNKNHQSISIEKTHILEKFCKKSFDLWFRETIFWGTIFGSSFENNEFLSYKETWSKKCLPDHCLIPVLIGKMKNTISPKLGWKLSFPGIYLISKGVNIISIKKIYFLKHPTSWNLKDGIRYFSCSYLQSFCKKLWCFYLFLLLSLKGFEAVWLDDFEIGDWLLCFEIVVVFGGFDFQETFFQLVLIQGFFALECFICCDFREDWALLDAEESKVCCFFLLDFFWDFEEETWDLLGEVCDLFEEACDLFEEVCCLILLAFPLLLSSAICARLKHNSDKR